MGARLYNTETRKPEDVKEDQLNQAIIDGTHSYKKGDRVNVLDTYGEVYNVDSSFLREAVAGGEYTIETPTGRAVREYTEERKGLRGDIEVAAKQFGDELLFGAPEIAFENMGDPLALKKWEALKAEHEAANIVGGIGGFAGSMLYGGPLFKGAAKAGEITAKAAAAASSKIAAKGIGQSAANKLGKGIVGKMGKNAVKYGTEGAVVSMPVALTEAVTGDPEGAAEALLTGVGFGSMFGVAGAMTSSFNKMVKKSKAYEVLKEKLDIDISSSPKMKAKAGDAAIKSLGPNLRQQEKLEHSLVYLDDETMKGFQKMGVDLIDEKIIGAMPSSKRTIATRLEAKVKEFGNKIDEQFQKIDEVTQYSVMISPRRIAEQIEKKVRERVAKDPSKLGAYRAFKRELDDLAYNELAPGREVLLNLRDANFLKANYQRKFSNLYGTPDWQNKDLLKEIPKAINAEIRDRIEAFAGKSVKDELITYQRKLGHMKAAQNIADKSAARASKNNMFGLTSHISGGALATVGAMVAGAPGAAVGGIVGFMGREFTRRYGEQMKAIAYDRAEGILFSGNALVRANQKLSKIPKILERMSKGEKIPKKPAAINAMVRLFGADEKDPKEKQFETARNRMAKWQENPDIAMKSISQVSGPLATYGAPVIAEAFSAKTMEAYNYLFNNMPKPAQRNNPFSPPVEYQPSDTEMSAYLQKAQIVNDPWSVFDELEAGTLTHNHMEALRTVYPKIYEAIQMKIYEAATDEDRTLKYSDRVNLGLLLGQSFDDSMDPGAIQLFQQNYVTGEPEDKPPPDEGAKIDLADASMTRAQQLTN